MRLHSYLSYDALRHVPPARRRLLNVDPWVLLVVSASLLPVLAWCIAGWSIAHGDTKSRPWLTHASLTSPELMVVKTGPAMSAGTQPPKELASSELRRKDQLNPSLNHGQPEFDGRPIRPVETLHMKVTGYSPDARSCGKWADGKTASGYSVWTNGMKLVAADTRLLPFGSLVSVPGYNGGRPVPVLDRGGKIKGHCLDLLYPTHNMARQWGVQGVNVTVWEYAD